MAIVLVTFPPGTIASVAKTGGQTWSVTSVNDAPITVEVNDADGSWSLINGEWDGLFNGGGNDHGGVDPLTGIGYLYEGTGSAGTLYVVDLDDTDGLATFTVGQDVSYLMNDVVSNTFDVPIDGTIVCFTPGAMIRCPQGEVPVEALRVGDLAMTGDGARAVRWIGRRRVSAAELALHPELRPVRIAAGSIAPGVPVQDLVVSPEHRMVLSGFRADALFGTREVLASARSLRGEGIDVDTSADQVDYIHIMFDDHQIIHANGAATESFHATAQGLGNLAAPAQAELLTLFPDLRTMPESFAQPARMLISDLEARQLATG